MIERKNMRYFPDEDFCRNKLREFAIIIYNNNLVAC